MTRRALPNVNSSARTARQPEVPNPNRGHAVSKLTPSGSGVYFGVIRFLAAKGQTTRLTPAALLLAAACAGNGAVEPPAPPLTIVAPRSRFSDRRGLPARRRAPEGSGQARGVRAHQPRPGRGRDLPRPLGRGGLPGRRRVLPEPDHRKHDRPLPDRRHRAVWPHRAGGRLRNAVRELGHLEDDRDLVHRSRHRPGVERARGNARRETPVRRSPKDDPRPGTRPTSAWGTTSAAANSGWRRSS